MAAILAAALQASVVEIWTDVDGVLSADELRGLYRGYRDGMGDGPRGTPTVDGSLVYALGGFGDLVCVNAADGKEVWRKNLASDMGGEMMSEWGYSESPLVDGDALYVQAGSALMRLLGTASVEVRLPLLASDVPHVRYGQLPDGSWPEAELTARFGDVTRSWPARLLRMEQRVDEQTRVFYLVAQVDAPYDTTRHPWPLSVGLFVEADIRGAEIPMATRIPRSALYDGDAVYVLEQGSMRKRPVTVLRREQDSVIVGAGLAGGDQVILSRLDIMADGMPAAAEK